MRVTGDFFKPNSSASAAATHPGFVMTSFLSQVLSRGYPRAVLDATNAATGEALHGLEPSSLRISVLRRSPGHLPSADARLSTPPRLRDSVTCLGIRESGFGIWVSRLLLQTPTQQQRPDRKAGANRHHQHETAAFEALLGDGVVQGKRNGRRRGVAETLDVDDDLFLGHTKLLGRGEDDAAVGLVRDEQIDVMGPDAVPIEDAPAGLLGVADGKLEHRLAVLLDVVLAARDGLRRCGQAAAASGHAQRRSATAVDVVLEIDDADALVIGRLDDRRPGAVAEDDARRPIRVVDDARHDVG